MSARDTTREDVRRAVQDAEQAVLSAMLFDGDAGRDARTTARAALTPDDFALAGHALLFRAMLALDDAHAAVEYLTLVAYLEDRRELQPAGGREYVAYLLDIVPTAANVRHHAAIVARWAEKRRLASTFTDFAREALDPESEPADTSAAAADAIRPVAAAHGRGGFVDAGTLAAAAVDDVVRRGNGEVPATTPLGFAELDAACGGAEPGDLVLVVMVSGHGKSAFGLSMLTRVAEAGWACAYVSAEMAAKQLTLRALASFTGLPFWRLRRGELEGDEWRRLALAEKWFAALPIVVDDAPMPDVGVMAARLRQLKAERPSLSHAVVDFAQILTTTEARDPADRHHLIANRLKAIAKECGIVLVVLAQPDAKLIERRSGEPMPQLADVAWGQGYRNAADTVVCGYRPGLYDQMTDDTEGRFSVEKSRASGKVAFALAWDGPTMTFRSRYAHQHHEPARPTLTVSTSAPHPRSEDTAA